MVVAAVAETGCAVRYAAGATAASSTPRTLRRLRTKLPFVLYDVDRHAVAGVYGHRAVAGGGYRDAAEGAADPSCGQDREHRVARDVAGQGDDEFARAVQLRFAVH